MQNIKLWYRTSIFITLLFYKERHDHIDINYFILQLSEDSEMCKNQYEQEYHMGYMTDIRKPVVIINDHKQHCKRMWGTSNTNYQYYQIIE